MATAKPKVEDVEGIVETEAKDSEVPNEQDEMLAELKKQGFILVQWIGGTNSKIAPSPTHIITKLFNEKDYGLVNRNEFLMVHKDDQKAAPHLYRKPGLSEKPSKDQVMIRKSAPTIIRVSWSALTK